MKRAWFSEGVTTETSGSSAACTGSYEVDVVRHPPVVLPHELGRSKDELTVLEGLPDRSREPPDRRIAEAPGQPSAQRGLHWPEWPATVALQHGVGLAHVDVDGLRGLLRRLTSVASQQGPHAPQVGEAIEAGPEIEVAGHRKRAVD